MSSITIVSDAPNCGVTYDRHYDDHNSCIIQATGAHLSKRAKICSMGKFQTNTFGPTYPKQDVIYAGP